MSDQQVPVAVVFNTEGQRVLNSPLVKIYRMTVFERTLKSLQAAGIQKIIIIGGKNQSNFAEIIDRKGPWQAEIELRDKRGDIPDDDILFLSEPLLITPRYIKEIIEAGDLGIVVATDPNNYVVYIPEKIRKSITDFTSNLNTTIKDLEASGFKRVIAQSIGRYVCEPIPDKSSRDKAIGRLIRSLRQPSDEFISRTFNRPISLFITRFLGHTPVTANQYTIFTGILGLITAFIFSLGGDKNFLIGGIMFHLLAVLDAGDGEIARLKFLASERGQWIDTIVDNITYVATLLGLVIGVYRSDPSDLVVYSSIAGVIFSILALVSLYVYLLKYNRGGSLLNIDYDFKENTGWYGKVMNVLQELGRRPFFSITFMFLGIFGVMEYSLVYISIITFFVFVYSIRAHIRIIGQKG
ncbi:MAG: CDP-alcohol phosphatidyltransferase family protein [Bacteroidetes bacterium]|nr:CDP-alcohol phosphatidyltransferase family protein [Bacteroidota bacterium]MDA1119387.1 CDP-alcohol phosphatidyltransferase family protein [Bacteroidota bacterium]